MNNFFSFFGRLFGSNNWKYFFETRPSYQLGQKGAIYLDVETPKYIFDTVPQINQVVRKKSAMFANMVIKLVDAEGNEVVDEQLYRLLENPNAMQSQNEFLKQYLEQKDIYGNQFTYKSQASALSTYPNLLWNISPANIQPELTGKIYDQLTPDGIIAQYKLLNTTETRRFAPNEIMWTRIADLDNPLVGISPLKSLRYPITNTKYAYDYFNVISNEKGAVGILANKSKDAMGNIPLTKEEREKLEKQYKDNYGLGNDSSGREKNRVILTESDMSWTPMSYPTKDLLLQEQIDANFLTIIDHFGLNVNIFSSKNQTYENVRNALIQCYQDTIMVEADQYCQSLSKFLGIPEGMKLIADYSHLSIFAKDVTAQKQDFKTISDSLSQLVANNVLTPLQAQEIMRNEMKVEIDNTANTVADKINLLSPLLGTKILEKFTPDETRDLVGLPKVEGGDSIAVPQNNGGF